MRYISQTCPGRYKPMQEHRSLLRPLYQINHQHHQIYSNRCPILCCDCILGKERCHSYLQTIHTIRNETHMAPDGQRSCSYYLADYQAFPTTYLILIHIIWFVSLSRTVQHIIPGNNRSISSSRSRHLHSHDTLIYQGMGRTLYSPGTGRV